MSEPGRERRLVDIDTKVPVWERFFTVAPLVLIGTIDEDGSLDLAPTGEFTVSYPKPSQVLYTSLAASPRIEGDKPILDYFETFPASKIDGAFIEDAYLYFECKHFKTIGGFGENCLITGEIVAAYAESTFIRASEYDSQELIHESPLFAYLSPGRFAAIDQSNAFPFPAEMKK